LKIEEEISKVEEEVPLSVDDTSMQRCFEEDMGEFSFSLLFFPYFFSHSLFLFFVGFHPLSHVED